MRKPITSQQPTITIHIQEKRQHIAQARIRLAVLVQIGRVGKAAAFAVEVENDAFADVEEEADGTAASVLDKSSLAWTLSFFFLY